MTKKNGSENMNKQKQELVELGEVAEVEKVGKKTIGFEVERAEAISSMGGKMGKVFQAIKDGKDGIYANPRHEARNLAKKTQKERAFKICSLEYPISYYAQQNKRGSFWGALFEQTYDSPNRRGEVVITTQEGEQYKFMLSANPEIEGDTTHPQEEVFATGFEKILTKLIQLKGKVRSEIIEKKQLVRPEGITFSPR